jgi:hypothetical protein
MCFQGLPSGISGKTLMDCADPRRHTDCRHSTSRRADNMSSERTLRREEALRQLELLATAYRRVAEFERIVAEWSALIGTMRAEGRDVTAACDLLETLKSNLEVRRSNRDLVQQIVTGGTPGSPQPVPSPA